MIKNRTIFLYGPQTAGKTTRLMRIVKHDHGRDILASGEDQDRVNNGREVCDVTLRVPKAWNSASQRRFLNQIESQLPVRHVLVDGAQFLSVTDIKMITRLCNWAAPDVDIVFAGCRYYVATTNQPAGEIPTSRFLINWCDRTVLVSRKCDFCNRIATRLFVRNFKPLAGNKIVAVDPHLMCNVHYQKLLGS